MGCGGLLGLRTRVAAHASKADGAVLAGGHSKSGRRSWPPGTELFQCKAWGAYGKVHNLIMGRAGYVKGKRKRCGRFTMQAGWSGMWASGLVGPQVVPKTQFVGVVVVGQRAKDAVQRHVDEDINRRGEPRGRFFPPAPCTRPALPSRPRSPGATRGPPGVGSCKGHTKVR
jgi:hypothetical protein